MSGEYIIANTTSEYWNELKTIYVRRSTDWKDLTQEEYEAIENSEREDSDNHLNEERLKDDNDTNVVDYCHYKSLPDRKVAYSIKIANKEGKSEHYYFKITLSNNIE